MFHKSLFVSLLMVVQGCTWMQSPSEPGIGDPVSWDALDGWTKDEHSAAWPALIRSCSRLRTQSGWSEICSAAGELRSPTSREARAFFEEHFRPHPVFGDGGGREGLITGYYEPVLQGSLEPDQRFRFPLYAPPDDLLTIVPGDAYPDLAASQMRGRLSGRKVVPYPTRAELESDPQSLLGSEILWVDDRYDRFFLHVQGSGRVRLPDGRLVAVGFADHNGHPYRSIGRRLIDLGELDRAEVSLFSIRRWLRDNPGKAESLLHYNPRYIFFTLRGETAGGPPGAMNVALTAGRSLAVDKSRIPLGAPVWLETSWPDSNARPLTRLMMAQDTGSAIRGHVRADVFWGQGEEAERLAGLMKQSGRMYVLLPRNGI